MNRGQVVLEIVTVAEQVHGHRFVFAKHAANFLLDAADYVTSSQDDHARISLRIAERVLGESPLALDVQQLHDLVVDLVLKERQHAPLASSMFETRKQIVQPDRYADGVARIVRAANAWTSADDIAEVLS